MNTAVQLRPIASPNLPRCDLMHGKAHEVIAGDAWSAVLTGIGGNNDKFLAAGLDGYEFANAAEIMRTYNGWTAPDFARFKNMMRQVFYPMNHHFLATHHGDKCLAHFYANWDLGNMASVLAIGVLSDDRAIYNEAIDYFEHGGGNGAIGNAVFTLHPGNLWQWQESGRDQGHATLGIGLMGAFCEMAWKQVGDGAEALLNGLEPGDGRAVLLLELFDGRHGGWPLSAADDDPGARRCAPQDPMSEAPLHAMALPQRTRSYRRLTPCPGRRQFEARAPGVSPLPHRA